MIKDEKAQISAELILLVGALLVIVIAAGAFVYSTSSTIAGNVNQVIDAGRNTAIDKL